MSEWWTYTLSDFLLFSPRTYYRLFERYNQAVWPAQIVTISLGLFLLGALRSNKPWWGRVVSGVLALLWIWVGLAFLWRRYANINWAVGYLVPLFALEAMLLIWFGVVTRELSFRMTRGATAMLGGALLLVAIPVYPLLAGLTGRSWRSAEVFGLAPDPTVLATLGLLLLTARTHWTLLLVPLLWCLFSGATLVALGSPEAPILLVAALLTLIAAARIRLERRGEAAANAAAP
jgi:hypothetical protein